MPPAYGVLRFIFETMTDRPNDIRQPIRSVRLREGQDPILRAAAAAHGLSVNAYILWRVFEPASPLPKPRRRLSRLDEQFAAQALALLGQSRIPNNLNQMARLANVGALDLTPEVLADLEAALQHVRDIRNVTYRALGLSEAQE